MSDHVPKMARRTGIRRAVVAAMVGALSFLAVPAVNAQPVAGSPDPAEMLSPPTKRDFGHYVNLKPTDTPADAAAFCNETNVSGVVKRVRWGEIEWRDAAGTIRYTVAPFQEILQATPSSCRLFLFVEWITFSDRLGRPCPNYLDGRSSNRDSGGYTCHLWEADVWQAYRSMLHFLGGRFDSNARVEGVILQETSTGLGSNARNYTVNRYYNALKAVYTACSNSFANSWCVPFMNFFPGDLSKLRTLMNDMRGMPNRNICLSGPDISPTSDGLYLDNNRIYEVLLDYDGCRSNSAQYQGYGERGPGANYPTSRWTICAPPPAGKPCTMDEIWKFGVRGTWGDFKENRPYDSGLCVNSFLFWNSPGWMIDGKTFDPHALDAIAAHPYGDGWRNRCKNDPWRP